MILFTLIGLLILLISSNMALIYPFKPNLMTIAKFR